MRIPRWVQFGISAAAVAIMLARIPARDLWASLEGLRAEWLLAALSSTLAMLAVRCHKWHGLLRAGGASRTPKDSAKSLLSGFALAITTPGRMGEFGRWLFVPASDRGRVFPLNILDRMFDSWALGTAAVASLALLRLRPYGVFALAAWAATLPLILGLPALVAQLAEWPRFRRLFPASRPSGCLTKIRVPKFLAWAGASTALDALTMVFLLRAFHPASPEVALLAFPWIVLAGSIPVTVSGLGLREGAAVWVLGRQAVPSAVAINAALLLSALSNLLPAVMGCLWILFDRTMQLRWVVGPKESCREHTPEISDRLSGETLAFAAQKAGKGESTGNFTS